MDDIIKEMIDRVQVYFTKGSGLYDINVKRETVDKVALKDGFLQIHDSYEKCWHCYNLNYVKHYHIPD